MRRIITAVAVVSCLLAPVTASPVAASTASTDAVPAAIGHAAAPVARTVDRWKCTTWTFVPPRSTTCRVGSADTIRVIIDGSVVKRWSPTTKTWVRIPYTWNTQRSRLEIDATKIQVARPALGSVVTVWRYLCSNWSLVSEVGPTTCLEGRAQRVTARFAVSGAPAQVRRADGTFVPTFYRWNAAGGYLALDARLVPAAGVDLGSSMSPEPAADVTDFIVACTTGSITASIVARGGGSVTFDGGTPLTRSTSVSTPLAVGQSVSWQLSLPGKPPVQQSARCRPDNMPLPTVTRNGTPASQWYLMAQSLGTGASQNPPWYVMVVDGHGTPVWWKSVSDYQPLDVKLAPGGGLMWTDIGITWSQTSQYRTFDWAGNQQSIFGSYLGLDQHDLVWLDNGNALTIRYVYRDCLGNADCVDMTPYGGSTTGTIVDCEIVELDPSGNTVWEWKLRDHVGFDEWADIASPAHIAQSRITVNGNDIWDINHVNSVEDDGDGVIISARHNNAVYRIRKSDGAITWKIGGTPRRESLTVLGLSDPIASQHDARRLANGNISVFDNGTEDGRAPRVLEMSIDTSRRTARVVHAISDNRIPFSGCCGSARRLSTGGWVIGWGGTGWITETDAEGTPILSMDFDYRFTYRAVPVEPGIVSRTDLIAGMEAMHPRA